MNKAFKVLWNQVRGSYVVASENQVTHGKPGKATKTIVAAAVAGLIASASAMADPVDVTLGWVKDNGTSKFIYGDGQELNIVTTAHVGNLIADLQAAQNGSLKDIFVALGQQTHEGNTTIMGVTGGKNFLDHATSNELDGTFGETIETLLDNDQIIEKIRQQFAVADSETENNFVGGTTINVGDENSSPIVMGIVGTDLVMNAGFGMGFGTEKPSELHFVRTGDSKITFNSGNSVGILGAGLSINANSGNSAILGATRAPSTSSTLNGDTYLNIKNGANVVGAFGAGAAIALGGKSTSTLNGTSHILVDSKVDSDNLEGISIGLIGGGLSIAAENGSTESTVTGTQIDVNEGILAGVIGGGVALGTDISSISAEIKDFANSQIPGASFIVGNLFNNKGGTAVTNVETDTILTLGAQASSAMVMGGGVAIANSSGKDLVSSASASSKNVVLNLEGVDFVFGADEEGSQSKGEYYSAALKFKNFVENAVKDLTTSDPFSLSQFITGLKDSVKSLNVGGVHVANLGGGLTIARAADDSATANATATVESVEMNLNGGYNVANLAGGIAVGIGSSNSPADAVTSTSNVNTVNINISGGENILTGAGGISYATASLGYQTEVMASTHVGEANITVAGGVSDGIYGGGIAVDDTNSVTNNASSTVDKLTINLSNGFVNEANVTPLTDIAKGDIYEGAPTNGAYINDTAKLIEQAHVAILGAGMATGGGALAETKTVEINLTGGEVNGSVFAGGAATFGGTSQVSESASITVAGAVVNGDIYAGGLAGSPRNEGDAESQTSDDYKHATSYVKQADIVLSSGEVNGNVYTGGYIYQTETGALQNPVTTVESATVQLVKADVFKGDVIDGSGSDTATLEFVPTEYKFAENQKVIGFDTIAANGSVSGLNYDFADRNETVVTGGSIDFAGIAYTAGENTLAIGDDQTAGVASVAVKNLEPQIETVSLTRADSQADFAFDVNNGLLSLNADSATAQKALATASSQAKAAAYVTGETDLTNIAVLVGNTEATEAGLHLGSDAMLVADAGSKTTEVTGTADTAQGTIHFVGVAEYGAKVTIAADDETATSVDNMLFKAVKNDNVYTFAQRTGDELAEVGLGDFDDPDFLADLSHHDTDGANYIAGFLDQSNTGVTNANRTQQLNAAVNLATAAGVQTAAIDSATMGLDAANKRASLIHEFADGGVLFAEASGRRTEMGGSADFGEIKAELGGVVVGGEYTTGDWTFGALANVGTGSVKGQGNNEGVDNDVDYYGGQLYAAKRFGQFNVVGQLGYLATSNEISHSTVAMNKADVDADVIMAGVRGEMRFDLTENSRLVPYVGVNYMRVGTDGYTTSQGVKVGSVDQNLFTVPVGVKYAGDMKTASGWTWTPSADVGYVAAFGDRDVDATTHVGAVGKTTMDVWAESVVRTSIGVKAVKDNFGVGVEAGGVMGSDDTTGVFGQIRVDYRF